MTAYKPYRHQLRRSLFASTIFPVFLVIIIGLVSFYAIYIWIEHRTIHQHVDESQSSLHHTEKQIQTFITQHNNSFQELDLTNHHDVTATKRELLKLIHQQPATLYYELSGPNQFITNNYEHLNTKNMYLFSTHQLKFKNSTYMLKIYMANTPRLSEIKKDNRQFALIVDQYDNILYANDDRFTIGEKYRPQQFGFMNESVKLNHADHRLIIYKDIHENIEDGITLLIVMAVVLVLLVIFGFISADNMAKRQTKDIETIIQKIYYAKNRHLGTYTPLKNNSELEEINNYIYDLFESNELPLSLFKDDELKALRQEIQMIFQDPFASINPRFKVIDVIKRPLIVHGKVKDNDDIIKTVVSLLEKVGLDQSFLYRYPHELSGGQRQRVSIARALAVEPKVIVCDEAVSALDVSIQKDIIELLKQLQLDFGITYLFITHDMGVINEICDRVAVMKNGEIVELNNTEDIIKHPQSDYAKQLISEVAVIAK
ncbi:TPA: ABC transporter ATP-binding protein [Staphylococcus aureus]